MSEQQEGRDLSEYLRDTTKDIADIRYSIFKDFLPEQLAHDIAYGSNIIERPEGVTAFDYWIRERNDAIVEQVKERARLYSSTCQALLVEIAKARSGEVEPTAEEMDRLNLVLIHFFGQDDQSASTLSNPDVYANAKRIVEDGTGVQVKDLYEIYANSEHNIVVRGVADYVSQLLTEELRRYTANPPANAQNFDQAEPEVSSAAQARGQTPHMIATDTAAGIVLDEFGFLDGLDIDEDALDARRNGGGEAIADDDADCEGCKI